MKPGTRSPAAAPAPRSRSPRTRRRRAFRFARLIARAAVTAALAGAVWIGCCFWLINSYSLPSDAPRAEAGIVLGAALWHNQPSPGLKERLDYALKLYREGLFDTFIVSGGYDLNGSTISEAEGMRAYLAKRGVPADRILLEEAATSTYENLLFSKAIMADRGLDSAAIVTHAYHAPRAREIAAYVHVPRYAVYGTDSAVLNMPYNQWREVLAYTKWKVDRFLLGFGIAPTDVTMM